MLARALLMLASVGLVQGQGTSCAASASLGQSTSTICGTATTCTGRTSNFISYSSQSYSADTNGRFTVQLTTNFCPNNANTTVFTSLGLTATPPSNSACCTQISLPVAGYVNNDAVVAAPLRGAAGYSLYGVQIYGPMENGFTLGQACSNSKGTCDPGWDVTTCSLVLEQQCGTAYVKYTMLLDDCGGHASPYHYHERMHCEYSYLDSSGHSPLIGFMLDGRGLYGQWESDGEKPTNLDACGGHNGTVPTTTKNSVTFNGGSFYHYHVGEFPTLNNCYGPSSSDTAAKAVYPTCSASATSVCTSQGQIDYLVDCPIGVRNLTYTATPTCPYCSGNCGVPTSSPSSLSPTSASPSSAAPTTLAPSSLTPTSASPSSTSPTSLAPTPPTTLAPSSAAPSSAGPTSSAPTVPSTQAPSSSSPSARASAGSLWNAGAMSLVVSGVICVVAGL